MPLAPQQLIQPAGELEPDMFGPNDPAGDTEARVAGWLLEAGEKTNGLADPALTLARKAWVYYRAYNSLATRIASRPSTALPDGSLSDPYYQAQIAEFRRLADYHLGVFNGHAASTEDVVDPNALRVVTLRGQSWFR